jgi:hypothetical protein
MSPGCDAAPAGVPLDICGAAAGAGLAVLGAFTTVPSVKLAGAAMLDELTRVSVELFFGAAMLAELTIELELVDGGALSTGSPPALSAVSCNGVDDSSLAVGFVKRLVVAFAALASAGAVCPMPTDFTVVSVARRGSPPDAPVDRGISPLGVFSFGMPSTTRGFGVSVLGTGMVGCPALIVGRVTGMVGLGTLIVGRGMLGRGIVMTGLGISTAVTGVEPAAIKSEEESSPMAARRDRFCKVSSGKYLFQNGSIRTCSAAAEDRLAIEVRNHPLG